MIPAVQATARTTVVRILLVDDQPLLRAGFRMILDAQPDLSVVGQASDGREALEMVERCRPDVVLMDVRMPGVNGIDATTQLAARHPDVRVLILTTFDVDEYVFAGLKAGASGFLLKDAQPEELVAAVRAVASGDAVVAPTATRRLIDAFLPHVPDPSRVPDIRLDRLTEREREVLVHIGSGRSNLEIAAALHLSEATIKTHVNRILAKLTLRDRVQAVVLAYDTGLVHPEPDARAGRACLP